VSGESILLSMPEASITHSALPPGFDVPAHERTLSIVSLNMARETDTGKVVRAFRSIPRLHHADVFLLQEVADTHNANIAGDLARRLGYFDVFAAAAPGVHDQGLSVLSRYPIRDVQIRHLKRYDLGSRSRSRFALSAILQTTAGDVRIWNAHLDTRINAAERVEQLQPVIEEAARCQGPQVIGGDLNTNDVYWLRNRLPVPGGASHGLAIRSAMEQHGFGTPFPNPLNTFPALRRHLDWIFVRDLRPLAASVEPCAFSDHHAIWALLSLAQDPNQAERDSQDSAHACDPEPGTRLLQPSSADST
jgi:endonuclease/exonuclease/phosphatase family metal-dependent hydrolase